MWEEQSGRLECLTFVAETLISIFTLKLPEQVQFKILFLKLGVVVLQGYLSSQGGHYCFRLTLNYMFNSKFQFLYKIALTAKHKLPGASSYIEFVVDTKINSAYKWGLWITQVIPTS